MHFSELVGKKVEIDFIVSDVKEDSRKVESGDIFVFDKRTSENGTKFIDDAIKNGAKKVITNLDVVNDKIYFLNNPFDALGRYAKYKYPKSPNVICGVTGTNGKTSVAWFYNCILRGAGKKVASIGTLGVYNGGELLLETGYTSPTPLVLHENLHKLSQLGVEYVCMEVSSHALDLHRCDSVDFTAAAFTNISPDHRDYHGSMELYALAKQRLFSDCLDVNSKAVLNIINPVNWSVASICKEKGISVLTVGSSNAELVVKQKEIMINGMSVEIKYETESFEVELPLIGAFQTENISTAIGLALSSGLSWGEIIKGVSTITSVPGRMEMISVKNKPVVVVDYAHTPDALKTAILSIKPQVEGKLWTVFGCGGDRDKTKRPEMGKIASSLSDKVIVTDDNPRTENASNVRKDIMAACANAIECGDRSEAIKLAIESADVDDIILLAGKGHESGQYINGKIKPFDDRDKAKEFLGA